MVQLLYHHGFLEWPRCKIAYYQNGSLRMVYGIGNKGAAVLKRKLAHPFRPLEWVGRIGSAGFSAITPSWFQTSWLPGNRMWIYPETTY
jgi:hypothetical protein